MFVFEYNSVADFLNDYIAELPKAGHGEASRIAGHLNISSTLLSQLLRQQRLFSTDQVIDLSLYLNLSDKETEYLYLLAEWEKAKTAQNKKYLKKKLEALKASVQTVAETVNIHHEISEENKYIFYSHWHYAAVHLFLQTSKKGRTIEEVSKHFNLTAEQVMKTLNFLVSMNLCYSEKAYYKSLQNASLLKQGSPYLSSHHVNWRVHSIARTANVNDQELMLTAPTCLSQKDFIKVKQKLLAVLGEIGPVVEHSEGEVVAILNIDWLKI